ncbi:CCN family member 2 [Dermacentor albipictus]|uniref:CCN family member 2 n=1 Tax=Dermacentor albipictus TaxID=60249 RepID=UPI0038FC7D07
MHPNRLMTARSHAHRPRSLQEVCVAFLLTATLACMSISSLAHPADAQQDDNSLDYSVFAGPPPEPSQCPGGAGCGVVVLDSGRDSAPSAEVVAPSSDDGGIGPTSDGGEEGPINAEAETTTTADPSSHSESRSPTVVGPRPPPAEEGGGGAPAVPVEYTIRAGKTNITVNGTRTSHRGAVQCGPSCRCSSSGPHEGGSETAGCPEGVSLVRDGCNCCSICARQQGDTCDAVQLCDARRQLHCVYPDRNASVGTCKVVQGQSCQVEGLGQYKDGATFKLDCRTQCSCQNGTYGCVSLCPHEGVRPSAECRNARLVRLRGNCCREWLCDHDMMKQPLALARASCERHAGDWSPCSATCGVGTSRRLVTDFHLGHCRSRNETRICNVRPCSGRDAAGIAGASGSRHRTRRNHLCRATVRATCAAPLTDGANCTSVTPQTPKYCGSCPGRRCCFPVLTTTTTLPFHCFEDGAWVTRHKDVMTIVRCRCKPKC